MGSGGTDEWSKLFVTTRGKFVETLYSLKSLAPEVTLRLFRCLAMKKGVLAAGACFWLFFLLLIVVPSSLSQGVVPRGDGGGMTGHDNLNDTDKSVVGNKRMLFS